MRMISCIANNEYIEASKSLDRAIPFQCPECEGSLILKAGNLITAHFAHKVDAGCKHGSGETDWHRLAKVWTARFLRNRGWKVWLEHRLQSDDGSIHRRADLFAINEYGYKTCFEFQQKDQGDEIYKRTHDLAQFCDEVVWVFPFGGSKFEYLYSKMWKAVRTYAIHLFWNPETRPKKADIMFFRDWSPNLLKCNFYDWVVDDTDKVWNKGTDNEFPKYCQIEIQSISGGGKYGLQLNDGRG
jgi:hypothetical protein